MAFRDFLLKSPEMFITLGERTGMVSHIASFWRYRFPKGRGLMIELDELFDILQDFPRAWARTTTKRPSPRWRLTTMPFWTRPAPRR